MLEDASPVIVHRMRQEEKANSKRQTEKQGRNNQIPIEKYDKVLGGSILAPTSSSTFECIEKLQPPPFQFHLAINQHLFNARNEEKDAPMPSTVKSIPTQNTSKSLENSFPPANNPVAQLHFLSLLKILPFPSCPIK